jgi:hypothetical protein
MFGAQHVPFSVLSYLHYFGSSHTSVVRKKN